MDGRRNGWVNVCDPVLNQTKYDYIISMHSFAFFIYFVEKKSASLLISYSLEVN